MLHLPQHVSIVLVRRRALVGDVGQPRHGPRPSRQRRRQQGGQGTRQRHLLGVRHLAQVDRSQPPASPVVDAHGGGAGFLIAARTHGNHDAVPSRCQHRPMAAARLLRLLQPQQQPGFLQLRHERQQRLAKARQRRTQPIVGPLQTVLAQQPRPHLGLRMVHRQPCHALQQRRGRRTAADAQAQPQGMQARFAVLCIQVVERAQRDGAEARGDACRRFLVDAIGFLAIADLARQRPLVVAFQTVRFPFEDVPARVHGGGVERVLQLQEPLRRHRLRAKFLDDLVHPLAERVRAVRPSSPPSGLHLSGPRASAYS